MVIMIIPTCDNLFNFVEKDRTERPEQSTYIQGESKRTDTFEMQISRTALLPFDRRH